MTLQFALLFIGEELQRALEAAGRPAAGRLAPLPSCIVGDDEAEEGAEDSDDVEERDEKVEEEADDKEDEDEIDEEPIIWL